MQEQTIQQLDEAVFEVFALMLNRECRPGKCSLQPSGTRGSMPDRLPGGLAALISFTGSLRGACTIHLALRTAATLASELLGETSDSSGALNADTAGELCNMIAGSWKSRQPTDGSSSALSAPTIIAEDLSCCPPANALDPRAFRYTLVRTYRFQDHCLRLELAFD